MRRSIVVLALGLVTLASCGGGSSTATPTATQLSAEEASKPSVEITYPVEGADPVAAGEVLVAVTVRSFGIVEPKDGKGGKGEGRLVYYLDVDPVPTGKDATDVPEGAARAKASAMTSHIWKKVSTGRHTLGVQLVNSDGSSLDPPVTDSVEIVVGA